MSLRQEDFPAAQNYFEHSLQMQPDSRPARLGLATVLLKMGKRTEAKQQINLIPEMDRQKPDVMAFDARILIAEKSLDAAETMISQAKKAGASAATLFELSAMCALAQKQYKTATEILQKAIRHSPNDIDLWIMQGQAQRAAGFLDASFETFSHALKLDANHPLVQLELGQIAIRDGEFKIALRRLNESLKYIHKRQYPHALKAMAFAALGRTYLGLNDTGRAITHLQDAIDLDASTAEPNLMMGRVYDRLDRPARAIPYYAKAIELEASLLEGYESLARAYAKTGDKQNATKYYEQYLQRNPPAAKMKQIQQELGRLQKP
jgi:tetratricopeptide (TPR) repeat protein